MTAKKVMSVVLFVIIGGVVLFVFLLYATVKTKTTTLNKHEPFKAWVGESVTLKRQAVLFKEKVPLNSHRDYPYVLLDSLHPQWQYVAERENLPDPDLEEIITFPVGTSLKLEKAVQYTNGVSGSSYPTIFGAVYVNETRYGFGYQWGEWDMTKSYGESKKYWKFHEAPWQSGRDTAYYVLPTANFW